VARWAGSEPTGFDRREAFLDARDVELGETTVLAQRGDAYLAGTGAETSLEADVHQYGGFRYREHWDVGDVVTIRNAERALSYPARIVEVEKAFERSAAAPTITAILGRPFPTLASQASSGRAAATADGAVSAASGGVPGAGRPVARAAPPDGLAHLRRRVAACVRIPALFTVLGTPTRRRRDALQPPDYRGACRSG
jgi:hypothetical protein